VARRVHDALVIPGMNLHHQQFSLPLIWVLAWAQIDLRLSLEVRDLSKRMPNK